MGKIIRTLKQTEQVLWDKKRLLAGATGNGNVWGKDRGRRANHRMVEKEGESSKQAKAGGSLTIADAKQIASKLYTENSPGFAS